MRRRQRPPVAPERILGPNHFAFYRGHLQGLDLGRLANRYLTRGLDLRLARTMLGWIEGELARGVKRLATRTRAGATGTERVLTERAWLALIQPSAAESSTARQARQRKLLRALDALQPLLLARPTPADAVSGWFAPAIAAKLAAAGWQTLGALQAAVSEAGQGWYRRVPGIGSLTARRIETWLQEQGTDIGATAATPVSAVGPLESLRTSAAQADVMAIDEWLGGHGPEGSHTRRAYRTQAERFLLWAVIACGKALSDITEDDCGAYLAFLADPQPAAQWVGPRGTPRDRHDWRPFEGPLSAASIRHARKILGALYAWLVKQQHASSNPFASHVGPKVRATPRIQVARSFTEPQWLYLRTFASNLPADDPRTARLRFMLRLAYASGLRISEQAATTVGNLTWHDIWTLTVPGARPRQIPLPEPVIDALRDHMEARGLGRDFERLPAATPLIGRVKDDGTHGALSVAQLGAIWKRFFAQAAGQLDASDATDAAQLTQASAHWMRHTAGTHAIARGVALDVVQQQLGHASRDTTSMYVLAA
ncbi:MAG: tyrosine-type recombinase/integrase [Cupriavidus sp.]|nr:tyrosine-type recombinase/integrase [Cupriavidus sp.]